MKRMTRILSTLLCLCMTVTLLCSKVLATGSGQLGWNKNLDTSVSINEGDSLPLVIDVNADGDSNLKVTYYRNSTSFYTTWYDGGKITLNVEPQKEGEQYYIKVEGSISMLTSRTLTVHFKPAAPTPVPDVAITKNPSGEVVYAGGEALFIAAAENWSKYEWRIVKPDGSAVWRNKAEIESGFPGVSVQIWTEKKDARRVDIYLTNIPESMDGYYVQCKFWSLDGNKTLFTKDRGCKISVNVPTPAPTAEPTATPTPSPTPTATTVPTVTDTPASAAPQGEVPAAAPVEPGHTHSYGTEWKHNSLTHWHECACGARADEASHDFVWAVSKEATKTESGMKIGVCRDCGESAIETLPATGGQDKGGLGTGAILAIAGVCLVAGIGAGILVSRKKQ